MKRSQGSSTIATLAYITGEKIKDERTGKVKNYGRSERVAHVEMDEKSSKHFKTYSELFNSLESFEKQKNARLAKKLIVALPKELTQEEQIRLVRSFVKYNFSDRGYPSVFAIHNDKGNPHVHIMVANRKLKENGEWEEVKAKKVQATYEKGKFEGKKIPTLDPSKIEQYEKETGKTFKETDFEYGVLCDKFQKLGSRNRKQWKRVNEVFNELDSRSRLKEIREDWATQANEYLKTYQTSIDHRTLKEQGIERIPTIHLGQKSFNAANREEPNETPRFKRNEFIIKTNNKFKEIQQELLASISTIGNDIKESINDGIRTITRRIEELRRERFRIEETITGNRQRRNTIKETIERIKSQTSTLRVNFINQIYDDWMMSPTLEVVDTINNLYDDDETFRNWTDNLTDQQRMDLIDDVRDKIESTSEYKQVEYDEWLYQLQDAYTRSGGWHDTTEKVIDGLIEENETFKEWFDNLDLDTKNQLENEIEEYLDQQSL